MESTRVVIAGIGAGSLGIELLKCMTMVNWIDCYGTDIDPHAYGHSDARFVETRVFTHRSPDAWLDELLSFAQSVGADVIAPGAEATHRILSEAATKVRDAGFEVMINTPEVIALCSDKVRCNDRLSDAGFPTAVTRIVESIEELEDFDAYPCVIKPARNSGGSNLVFLAENASEASFFTSYLATRGYHACVQEYILGVGEYTVGVLSARGGEILSSIALRRDLTQKLSRSMAYDDRVISSGWSQGRIDRFPEICEQAEAMARALGSTWALNVQGRLRDGRFLPFEINPRHSGTSYLRALAGINEPVMALANLQGTIGAFRDELRPGQYQRVLAEHVIRDTDS